MTMAEPLASALLAWRRQNRQRCGAFVLALLALVALVFASLGLGAIAIGPAQTFAALTSRLLPAAWMPIVPAAHIEIVQNLRLPRTLMGLVAGAGLSLAGAAMQGITRNVLVSPFTVGISPAAAFGASLAILLGLGARAGAGPYLIVAAAFASALVCAALVLTLSSLRGVGSTMLILSGVGLTYLFSSLTATAQFIATEQQLASIVHWTFGSFNASTWSEVAIVGAICGATMPIIFVHAAALNAFAAGGDDVAASLGFAVVRTRLLVTVATVLITASIVSFVGVIGFVGLVGPHIARLLIGGDHRVLLPFAAIVGALLLLVSDLIGRLAFAPVIIPVGIVVAYLGVPIFLQLLLSRRHEWAD